MTASEWTKGGRSSPASFTARLFPSFLRHSLISSERDASVASGREEGDERETGGERDGNGQTKMQMVDETGSNRCKEPVNKNFTNRFFIFNISYTCKNSI